MNLGVQGLDPAVQHLGEAGEVRDLGHLDAGLPQYFGGAAGGQDLHFVAGQELAELDDAALNGDADQGPGNGFHACTSLSLIFRSPYCRGGSRAAPTGASNLHTL